MKSEFAIGRYVTDLEGGVENDLRLALAYRARVADDVHGENHRGGAGGWRLWNRALTVVSDAVETFDRECSLGAPEGRERNTSSISICQS